MTGVTRANCLREGMRFKNYMILESAGRFDGESDERPQWKVECDCGLIKVKVNRKIRESLGSCGVDCKLKLALPVKE